MMSAVVKMSVPLFLVNGLRVQIESGPTMATRPAVVVDVRQKFFNRQAAIIENAAHIEKMINNMFELASQYPVVKSIDELSADEDVGQDMISYQLRKFGSFDEDTGAPGTFDEGIGRKPLMEQFDKLQIETTTSEEEVSSPPQIRETKTGAPIQKKPYKSGSFRKSNSVKVANASNPVLEKQESKKYFNFFRSKSPNVEFIGEPLPTMELHNIHEKDNSFHIVSTLPEESRDLPTASV